MSDAKAIARELWASRNATGLSRERVGRAMDVSAKTIERWETSGRIGPAELRELRAFYERAMAPAGIDNVVPRGTSPGNGTSRVADGPPGPRFAWARVVALDRVRAFLRAFGDELHALDATPDEEEEAVRSVRESGDRAYNAERKDWTEDEAIDLMKLNAEPIRAYFTGLKRRRR